MPDLHLPVAAATGLSRLRDFVAGFTRLIEANPEESVVLAEGRKLLAALVAQDDWLPDQFAEADPQHYRQYLLHCDPLERFSVVSFVWGPGQKTPVHDHRTWGLIGVLRGSERERRFIRRSDGRLAEDSEATIARGAVEAVSPKIGDIHQVTNGDADHVSISIHVYGGNIGQQRRATYDPVTGAEKLFISGYSSRVLPNFWDNFDTKES